MHSFTRVLLFAPLLIAVFVLPVRADTLYSYTGDRFNFVQGSVYSPGDEITGSFVLSDSYLSAFAPGAGIHSISSFVTRYSFTDGHQTLTQLNSTALFEVGFAFDGTPVVPTDGGSANAEWDVVIQQSSTESISTGDITGDYVTSALMGDSYAQIASYSVSRYPGGPGTWTIQRVPEPSTLLLLGVGIACIAAFGLFRRQSPTGSQPGS
jgi:hypothetical protein